MLFKSLQLTNFLSFGSESKPFDLGPLNVLIGPNGSGKSNFIEAFSMLRNAAWDIGRYVQELGGGVSEFIHKGVEDNPTSACIDAVLNRTDGNPPLRYKICFSGIRNRFMITDERIEHTEPLEGEDQARIFFEYEEGRPILNINNEMRVLNPEDVNFSKSILNQVKEPGQFHALSYLEFVLSNIQVLRDWTFGRFSPQKAPQRSDFPSLYLFDNATNLGHVLSRIKREPAARRNLLEHLRELYDGIDDFEISFELGFVQVILLEGPRPIPASRLSDGTLRYLALLACLCNPNPPPFTCIEEPELGLHPDILPGLAELTKEASKKTQLVITTHSDVLVDAFTDTPETVVICEKTAEGTTQMKRLDKDKLSVWLKDYSLGTLWTDGEIGGTRW